MPFLGEFSALATACFWAVGSMVTAAATARISVVQFNTTRMMIAAAMLWLSILTLDIELALSSSQILKLMLSGMAGLVFGDTFLFKGIQRNGARISMLIMSLAPAMAAMLGYIFLDEWLTVWSILGMIFTLLGVALVVLERTPATSTRSQITKQGVFFAFLGALGQAIGLIIAKTAFTEGAIHGFVATFVRISGALLILLPGAILTRHYHNPIKVFSKEPKAFSFVVISAFLGSYLGITFSLIAVAHTKVGIASTIMATTPIIMLPLVKMFYHEHLTWRAISGASLAVGGVAMLFLI